jgi:hypothetical protein
MNEEHVFIGNGGNDYQTDSINQETETSSLANSIPKVMKEEQVVINMMKEMKIKQILKTKDLEHLLDGRRFVTQEVMIFYG